jgi:hypothetical protein
MISADEKNVIAPTSQIPGDMNRFSEKPVLPDERSNVHICPLGAT